MRKKDKATRGEDYREKPSEALVMKRSFPWTTPKKFVESGAGKVQDSKDFETLGATT